jgi:hypothetical protein
MSLKGWLDDPLLGVGSQNFYVVADRWFTPELYEYTSVWPDKPHNIFFERLVTTGIVGTIAWIAMMLLLYRSLWKKRNNPQAVILLCGLIASLVHFLFFFDTLDDSIVFWFVLAIAVDPTRLTKSNKPRPMAWIPGLAGMAMAVLGTILLVLPMSDQISSAGKGEIPDWPIIIDDILVAKTAYSIASNGQDKEDINRAIELFERSLSRHPLRQALWNDLSALYYFKAVVLGEPVEQAGLEAVQRAADLAPGRREAAYIFQAMLEHKASLSDSP